jgi:hypothetical protein
MGFLDHCKVFNMKVSVVDLREIIAVFDPNKEICPMRYFNNSDNGVDDHEHSDILDKTGSRVKQWRTQNQQKFPKKSMC